jgi:hypothetical protein
MHFYGFVIILQKVSLRISIDGYDLKGCPCVKACQNVSKRKETSIASKNIMKSGDNVQTCQQ